MRYRSTIVDGIKVFYREAGAPTAPTLLLLHGFPTASHMFRDLIPRLASRFHLIAPDLPGFGQSDMPARDRFSYTFDNIAHTIAQFVDGLGQSRFALYVFDYGAPVGFRLALAHPERVTGIVSQNGNAYEEGLSPRWNSMREFWRNPTREQRESFRSALAPQSTPCQYLDGVPDVSLVSPDGIALDNYYLARPGAEEVQLDLFLDYATNVALYPTFQRYFRDAQPPLLAVWGRHDPYFLPAGALAFKRDIPTARVELLDTGHFALETHGEAIANLISEFLP